MRTADGESEATGESIDTASTSALIRTAFFVSPFDQCSTVGSTNLDYWSLLTSDEVNVVVLNREFAGKMEEMFAMDLARSDQIHLGTWQKRSPLQKFKEAFGHIFVQWL
jgi:phosphatidylserine/phosphatidylglycerophosphate/cardiolipin synthase-like enzyme